MKPTAGERVAQVLLALLKSGCYLALFMGMQILVMMPVALAAAIQIAVESGPMGEDAMEPLLMESPLYSLLIENTMLFSLISGMLTLIFVLVFYLVRRKKLSEALWLRRVDAPTLFEGMALAPGLYLVVSMVLFMLPASWTESYNEASSGIATGSLVGVIAVAVVAPVVEEVIFRGLIMTRLGKAMPSWLAVLLSAVIFGVCHGHPVWFGYAFVLGAVFGLMDLQAGSILPSILAHVAFNSFSQILSFLPDSNEAALAAIGVLFLMAIVAPILDRKAIAAMFRKKPKPAPLSQLPALPGVYEFDPWEI